MRTAVRRRLPAIAVLLIAAVAAPDAAGLPGDPPITQLTPADGVTVPAGPGTVTVTFRCPAYRAAIYDGGDGNVITDYRSGEDYRVRFSSSPATDGSGSLAADYGGIRTPTVSGDQCSAALDSYDGGTYASAIGKRVYWQVDRPCNGCTPQDERSGVRSFSIRPQRIAAKLVVPQRLYAGYPALFAVKSAAEPGAATVRLQRRAGTGWRTFARHSYVTDRTELVGTLPRGKRRLRAVLATDAFEQTVAERSVTVHGASGTRRTSAGDDGAYAARDAKERRKARLKFRIADGGRTLRGFSASVTTFCIGPTADTNRLYVATAVLGKVKVAPDGSVTGYLATKKQGSELKLTGRLRHRRFRGQIDARYSTCGGVRKLDAVRR